MDIHITNSVKVKLVHGELWQEKRHGLFRSFHATRRRWRTILADVEVPLVQPGQCSSVRDWNVLQRTVLPETPRAAVWEERGAVSRRRSGVGWRSGYLVPHGEYYDGETILKAKTDVMTRKPQL